MANLPENWIEAPFTKPFDIQGGTQPPKSSFIYEEKDGYIRLLQIRDFGQKPVPTYIPIKKTLKTCSNDDILIARYGASIGRILTGMSGAYNVAIAKVLIPDNINKRFVFYLLNSLYFQQPILSIERSAQDGFNKNDLERIILPFPPLKEQKRIVAKLDKIMPKIERTNERLDKIPSILKRFRQSVLTQAVTGELTKDWRSKHNRYRIKLEMLDNINTELSKLYKEHKVTKENSKCTNENITELENNNWFKIRARFLCHHITKGTTPKIMTETGDIPYLKVYNIVNNKIDFIYKPQFVSNEVHINFLTRSKVYPNDVVMNIVGPPLGKVAIIPNDFPEWNINQAIAIFRPIKYLSNEFLYIVLCCESTLLDVLPDVRGIVGQSNISLEQCRDLNIPLPTLEEQEEIVKRVKALFAKADKIEERYKKAKAYTDKLTQSILNKAFKGELVPQDPTDKPVEIN